MDDMIDSDVEELHVKKEKKKIKNHLEESPAKKAKQEPSTPQKNNFYY